MEATPNGRTPGGLGGKGPSLLFLQGVGGLTQLLAYASVYILCHTVALQVGACPPPLPGPIV